MLPPCSGSMPKIVTSVAAGALLCQAGSRIVRIICTISSSSTNSAPPAHPMLSRLTVRLNIRPRLRRPSRRLGDRPAPQSPGPDVSSTVPDLYNWIPTRKVPDLPTDVQLSAHAHMVYARANGIRSAVQIAWITGYKPKVILEILEGLVALELIDPPPPPSSPAGNNSQLPTDLTEPLLPGYNPHPTHRALWYREFAVLPVPRRIAAIATASDELLTALAYDPDPKVIQALLQSPRVGPAHARIVALVHSSSAGLDALYNRVDFLTDADVLRALLKNGAVSEAGLLRALGSKGLHALHSLVNSAEVHSRSRPTLLSLLARAFHRATAE
ncbi:MAG: hypothetical protein IPK82_31800 [Polyangiaceae bacterium]|nr:hypothetical protein [Polyangiaceae bacterium]